MACQPLQILVHLLRIRKIFIRKWYVEKYLWENVYVEISQIKQYI